MNLQETKALPGSRKVSVVVTTYNSSNYIANALRSIMAQAHVCTEIIIVDDCSQDLEKLALLVDEFAKTTTIKLIKNTVKGNANISRNIGIVAAKHPYVAFLDADDTWQPLHLHIAINTIKENKLDACFCKVNLVSKNGTISPTATFTKDQDISNFIFLHNGISVTSSLVVTRTVFQIVTFDNKLEKHQDWDFLIRFARQLNLGQSDYVGLNYTLSTGNNMSSNFNFKASITFMNNTLNSSWHKAFITSQISRVISTENYVALNELKKLLKQNYQYSIFTLGTVNASILLTSRPPWLFSLVVLVSKMKTLAKNTIKKVAPP